MRLQAVMNGVSSIISDKSLWSEFWTTLFGPCFDEPVIDLTAISTLRITTLSIAVKIVSWTRLSTSSTTLSTYSLLLSAILLSMIWLWLELFLPSVALPKLSKKPSSRSQLHLVGYCYQWQNRYKTHLVSWEVFSSDAFFASRNHVWMNIWFEFIYFETSGSMTNWITKRTVS